MRNQAFYFLLFGIHLLVPSPWHIFNLQPSSTQPKMSFWTQCGNTAPFLWNFSGILTGSLATCLETSRGGAEFSKPYSEEEHQDRGITLGLHYVISSEPSAVNSVLDSYLLTIPTERRDALSEITFSTSEDRLAALERVSGREEGRSASMLFV